MTHTQKITARSLLLGFLDLRSLSPDFGEWTEKEFSDNPPRLLRLRQLKAMFRAFDLPWKPSSFTSGAFIRLEHPRYAPLLSRLKAEYEEMFPDAPSERIESRELPMFFEILFDYRMSLNESLSFPANFLEASELSLLAVRKTMALNKVIRSKVVAVEKLLAELICPEGTSFSVRQLVRDYDYPDVDLIDIDIEWE
ncbi:MAG: hypothetical protein LBB65_04595 [Burkholderiales bacterium]|jgi:hypothetical protein|nr:hypothetical protein [Burkholderiales bacterium]